MNRKQTIAIICASIASIIFVIFSVIVVNKIKNYEVEDKYTSIEEIRHITTIEMFELSFGGNNELLENGGAIIVVNNFCTDEDVLKKVVEYANYKEKHKSLLPIYIYDGALENSIELNVIKNGETAIYKTKDEIINYFTQILNTQ